MPILLMDCEPQNLTRTKFWIQLAGYQVVSVSGVAEVQRRLESKQDWMVIVDTLVSNDEITAFFDNARIQYPDVFFAVILRDTIFATVLPALDGSAAAYFANAHTRDNLLQFLSNCEAQRKERLGFVNALSQAIASAGPKAQMEVAHMFGRALSDIAIGFHAVSGADGDIKGWQAQISAASKGLSKTEIILQTAQQLNILPALERMLRASVVAAFRPTDPHTLVFVPVHHQCLVDDTLLLNDEPLLAIAHQVVLQVVEPMKLEDSEVTRQKIKKLRAAGYRLAIDDVPAYYVDKDLLSWLNPDYARLDLSNVQRFSVCGLQSKLVEAVTRILHKLNIRVIAKGVELQENINLFQKLGCDLYQDYTPIPIR